MCSDTFLNLSLLHPPFCQFPMYSHYIRLSLVSYPSIFHTLDLLVCSISCTFHSTHSRCNVISPSTYFFIYLLFLTLPVVLLFIHPIPDPSIHSNHDLVFRSDRICLRSLIHSLTSSHRNPSALSSIPHSFIHPLLVQFISISFTNPSSISSLACVIHSFD